MNYLVLNNKQWLIGLKTLLRAQGHTDSLYL